MNRGTKDDEEPEAITNIGRDGGGTTEGRSRRLVRDRPTRCASISSRTSISGGLFRDYHSIWVAAKGEGAIGGGGYRSDAQEFDTVPSAIR